MILRALGRLVMVPLAFLLASGTALAVLFTLGLERITHAVAGRGDGAEIFFEIAGALVGLVGAATVVPSILVVIVGEVARIRSGLYYVLGGGMALAVLPLLAGTGTIGSGEIAGLSASWPVFATAGFAGGLVYWLLAGRNA
ncbi:MAG: hypothetical protein SFW09_03430 [Hyphomicrobiaceae bacterium]|nr:hypothetical protein [Hyphomicrobiaceae bacterium]